MIDTSPFPVLLARVRNGDHQAIAELISTHEPRIRRAIRQRLATSPLRRLFDSNDITQSVFGNFFPRLTKGEYSVADSGQFMKLLVTMARNKFRDHVRRHGTSRRGGGTTKAEEAVLPQVPAPGATPSQIVGDRELLEEIRRRLNDEERSLAASWVQGEHWGEIAKDRGVNAETLRKRLARAIQRVTEQLNPAEAPRNESMS